MDSSTKMKKTLSGILYVISAVLLYNILYKIVILIKFDDYSEWNLKLFIITFFIFFGVFALQQFLNKAYHNFCEIFIIKLLNYQYYHIILRVLKVNSLLSIILFIVDMLIIPLLLVITYSSIKISMENIIESILWISFCFLSTLIVVDIWSISIIGLYSIIKKRI
jgi:hypothetical protein